MNAIEETRLWLERAVIGLGLCPFAKSVFVADRIRYTSLEPETAEELIEAVETELHYLDENSETSTTLIIVPSGLEEFLDYLDIIAAAEERLSGLGYEGTYQIASFHPDYVFADAEASDAGNLTNRSPYPTLHLIREEEMESALSTHPAPEKIPERNVRVCRELGFAGMRALLEG